MNTGINSVFGPVYNQQSYAYRKQNQEYAQNGGSQEDGSYFFGYNPNMDYSNRQEEWDSASMEAERVTTDENGDPCLPYYRFSDVAFAKAPFLGLWGAAYPGGDGYHYDEDGNRMVGVYGGSGESSAETVERASASSSPDTATSEWLDQTYPSGGESDLIDNILDRIREILAGAYEQSRSDYEALLADGAIDESDYYRGLATLSQRQEYKLESYVSQLESLDLNNSADRAILNAMSRIIDVTENIEGIEDQEQLKRAFTVFSQYEAALGGGASDEYAAFVAMVVNSESSALSQTTTDYGNANPLLEKIESFRQYLLEGYPEVDLGLGELADTVAARARYNALNVINPWSMSRTERGTGLLFVDQDGDGVADAEDGEIISGLSLEERDRDGDGIADDNYIDRESLDTNGDGKISGEEWSGVKLWFDANGDGESTSDEVVDYSEALRNAGTLMGADGRQEVRTYELDEEGDWPYHAVGADGGLGVELEYLDPNNTNYYIDENGEKQTFGVSSFVKLVHSLCASQLGA